MVLERIFKDKDYWQEDAFNRIKSELLSVKDNRFVQYSNTAATHLVCVYGKAQVGKTTLILNMIGLKDDKCKKDVADVLRGGIARGNSSTSTAIIYSQSDSDLYGIRIETLEGQNLNADVEYCTKDEMLNKLEDIRSKVEDNNFSNKEILHIFIPKNYFSSSESDNKNKISILDLPGDESRNIKEKAHVKSLMTRYIPLSSVCIITCTANEIQSLENLELPNNIEWKNLPHKFFVVVTKSYSVGNIKDYFKQQDNTFKHFKDFLQNQYNYNLSRILGKRYKTKIFLLDLGDSFVRLCKELQNEKDCREVIETRNDYLDSLRDSILGSKSNNLLSCVKELKVIVNQMDKKEIQRLESIKENKEDELKKLSKYKEDFEKKSNEYESDSKNNESHINELKNLKKELVSNVTSYSDDLIAKVKKEVEEKPLYKTKNGINYFYDKDKICLTTICNDLSNRLKTIVSRMRSLMEEKDVIINHSDLANKIYSQFVNEYESKLYPPSNLFNRLIGNKRKIDLRSAYDYIQKIKKIIDSKMRSEFIENIDNKIGEYSKGLETTKGLLKSTSNRKKLEEVKIECIKEELKVNSEELAAVEYKKDKDIQTLNGFLNHAREAYFSQRNEIFNNINSKDTSSTAKFFNIVLLGIIDKDYKLILNASNE